MEFGQELAVVCEEGFRAFSIPNPSYWVTKEYTVRCASTCALEATFADMRCREVTCGAFAMPNTRLQDSPQVMFFHSTPPLLVRCLPGQLPESQALHLFWWFDSECCHSVSAPML